MALLTLLLAASPYRGSIDPSLIAAKLPSL